MSTPQHDPPARRPLVIGVGNPYRRDDGMGPAVAQALRQRLGDEVEVKIESGEGAALLESWHGAATVVLIDAVASGAEAGTVHRFDAAAQPLPVRFFHYSTHAFSVAEAVELARTLGQLPPRLIVYGVEGADFAAGKGLSDPVARAVEPVIQAIIDDLGHVSQ